MTSERVVGQFGKLPPHPEATHPRLHLATALSPEATALVPPLCDYLAHVTDWPMYGNATWGDCISPETRVLRADLRWVPASELRPGDRLFGFTEDSRAPKAAGGIRRGRFYELSTVETAAIIRRPCYDLLFEDGTKVRASAGHQWLVRSTIQGELNTQRWLRTDALRDEAPCLSSVIKPLDAWETDQSYAGGYLAAAYDGEGNIDQHRAVRDGKECSSNRLAFSQVDNEMLAEVERCLKELDYQFSHLVQPRGGNSGKDGAIRKDIHRISIEDRSEWLRFLGSIRPVRLLPKVKLEGLGRIKGRAVRLVKKTFVGEQDVVWLNTTSRTYFAEGLASHNCVWAGFGHQEETYSTYGQGHLVKLTDADIIKGYESTGFDPNAGPSGNNPTDQGTNVQDGLGYFHKTGLGNPAHTIAGYLAVDPANTQELAAAVYYFGHVGWGFAVPAYAEDQFNNGEPWDLDPSGDQTVLGGHYVCGGAYNLDAKTWTVITWGQVQQVTDAFFAKWAGAHEQGEAWVAVSQEWVNAQGVNPAGLNLAALEQEWQSIAPGKPFPLTPPVNDNTDTALAALLHKLERHHWHHITHADLAVMDAWLTANGL